MGKPRAIFKNVSEKLKSKFKYSKALLTISVGQQTHEGEHFQATMELINNSFDSCVIVVGDCLQRYTVALHANKNNVDHFYNLAINLGQSWVERNKKYYDSLTIPKQIIYWNKWLEHPNFSCKRNEILKLIDTDVEYRNAFEKSVNAFLDKYCSRLDPKVSFERARAYELSLNFVIEECTAMCLWIELQADFELYPHGHNLAMEETRKRFVTRYFPHLLQGLTILFKNTKSLKPQCYDLYEETREQCVGIE